jgi:acyl-CoA reductase-like NAD-dependent aldehyde dehydrogenase
MAVTTKAEESKTATSEATAGEDRLASFNPATGERVGDVPTVTPAQVQSVVDDVGEVQPFWAQLSLAERARYMRRATQVVVDHADEIAELLTREQGKPRIEAYTMEVMPTIDLLDWCASNGQKILADEPIKYTQLMLKQKKSFFSYEPIGVVGVIAPWNYPWSIPFGEVAIALMAGNGVVLKPASLTPLIGQ